MKTLYMVSLGCPKNLIDSEVMLAALERAGYRLVASADLATLVLINTCGFIRPAVEEAIDTVLTLAENKEKCPGQLLVVAGCMVQRYGEALVEELPEVDLFVGLDDFHRLDELVADIESGTRCIVTSGAADFLMDSRISRRIATPPYRSYLKITEGCNNRCTYCLIPSIRGVLRSRTISDLTSEAVQLEQLGVRELSLVAQDLTGYGRDLQEPADLVLLLESLLEHTSIPWFRLLYAYPSGISDALLQLMVQQPRILPYIDVPFQHASDTVLTAMNRHYRQADLDDVVRRIRSQLPECAIRTTLIVGFPGETEKDVEILRAALERWQLDHVGVFQYHDEEGSLASALSAKVSAQEKKRRYQLIMEVQAKISAQRQHRFVGRVEPVLIEGVSQETDLLLEGRSRFQAPEIDGCVYITSGKVSPGDIVPVRITEAHTYDLVGEVIAKSTNA